MDAAKPGAPFNRRASPKVGRTLYKWLFALSEAAKRRVSSQPLERRKIVRPGANVGRPRWKR